MAAKRVGAGNFAENPERAAEAGRKGGQLIGGYFTIALSEPVKRASKEGLVRKKGVQTQLLPDVG